jgi:DNA-binding MarR family transcriptional regulator
MRARREDGLLERLVSQGWVRGGRTVDLVSRDGARGLEVSAGAQGVRDLDASALRLARWVAERAGREGCLVLLGSRLTAERLRREWEAIRRVLRPDLGRRIALLAGPGSAELFPWVRPLVRWIGAREAQPAAPSAPSAALTPTVFEVLKIVVRHWLLRVGPLSRRRLQAESGATYPTVARALRKLEEAGELERLPNRRVQLRAFPRKTWQELLPLAAALRRRAAYVDATGRRPDPAALLRKLESLRPAGVALGGVAAARHWDRRFDLHGTPRIDLVVHAPRGTIDAGFVGKLDGSLRAATAGEPVLVLHPLPRAAALFDAGPRGLPFADPVETLLDLHELRLTAQAAELVDRLARR